MKLKFKTQDFQTDAVNAVADLFSGQDKQTATFSIFVEENNNGYVEIDEGVDMNWSELTDVLVQEYRELSKKLSYPVLTDISYLE